MKWICGKERRRRRVGIGFSVFMALLLAMGLTPVSAAEMEANPYSSYAKKSDGGDDSPTYVRPAFQVSRVIDGARLGVGDFSEPSDVVTGPDGRVYILDNTLSRIVVLDQEYQLSACLDAFVMEGETGEEEVTFPTAEGLFVTQDNQILIADTENHRVLIAGLDQKVTGVLTLPDSELIPEDFQFLPIAVVRDKKGFTYVLSRGSYYGALVYSRDDSFFGFFGANLAESNVLSSLANWLTNLFSSREMRASRVQSLPYQFTNLCLDSEDMLFSLTAETDSNTGQVRRLSPSGDNILTYTPFYWSMNADSYPFGDSFGYADLMGYYHSTAFTDLTVDDNGLIYVLDRTYGKIFVYDENCNSLSIFGSGFGDGTQKGAFVQPVALDTVGEDIVVLDKNKQTLTVFEPTDFGRLISQAVRLNNEGEYEQAYPLWEEIIRQDRNFTLAYSGIAKGLYVQGDYSGAMTYAKTGKDRGTYSMAFQEVRQEFMTANFPWIFLLVIVLVGGVVFFAVYTSKKQVVLIRGPKVRTMVHSMTHPIDSFQRVRWKEEGSLLLACLLLLLYYVVSVFCVLKGGFMYFDVNLYTYDAFYTLLSTVGLVLLFTLVNGAISTLREGKGKYRHIFCVACYALLPKILAMILQCLLSYVLVPSESSVIDIFLTIADLWFYLLLFLGVMTVHEFSFSKTLTISILTLLGMALTGFVILLVLILFQDFYSFLVTVFQEAAFRLRQ